MRKEKPAWLVLITIWFLLLMIILPPAFRVFFKVKKTETSTATVIFLVCQKSITTEGYNIISNTKYINNVPKQNIIKYTKLGTATTTGTTVTDELQLFSSVPGLDIATTNNITTIIITKDTNANLTTSYLNNYQEQLAFYKNKGYTCTSTKS